MSAHTVTVEIPGSASDQARQWLIHLYSGDATQADYDALETWLAKDPTHRMALKRAEAVWHNIGLFDDLEMRAKKIDTSRRRRFTRLSVMSISRGYRIGMAASILLALCALVFQSYPSSDYSTTEYVSLIGENTIIELEDGSVVTLSGDSKMMVKFSDKQRIIKLIHGSAYFQVASDSARAFSVTGQYSSVRVLGTEFIFWQGIDIDRISVTEGEVSLSLPGDDLSLPAKKILPGEQVTVDKDGTFSNTIKFDPKVELAWVNRRLIYDGELLHNIIIDMNRYHEKNISLKNKNTNTAITIAFSIDDIDKALSGLASAHGFDIYEDGESIKIINN